MRQRKWVVIVEWEDVFGEEHYAEIPCKDESHMKNVLARNRKRLWADDLVAWFRVNGVCR